MAVDLKDHPGLNPSYFEQMERRKGVQAYNRHPGTLVPLSVPKQPNKYVPHIGAKQRAKAFDVDKAVRLFNTGSAA